MLLLLLYLLLALVVSFLCSIAESVLLSTPISYLLSASQDKTKRAIRYFYELKMDVERPLSAILSLNTVAHTIGAAGVGAQAVKVFGDAYFGVISAILTILILVITEIIPKTVGARYWKSLVKPTALLIKVMIFMTYPLVKMSGYITSFIANDKSQSTISREEVSALAKMGAQEGIFTEAEKNIIQNVLRLQKIKAPEIMTPRVVVTSANQEMRLSDFFENKELLKFSRIPVYESINENIKGYVLLQDVFEKLAEDQFHLTLKDIIKPIEIAPFSVTLFHLWDQLLETKNHIALIVDEYGGMEGIVTMEDIFECLLGLEIVDEKDIIPDMREYAKQRWDQRQKKYQYLSSQKFKFGG
jgi:CBS domain containing-hemolysin-like protein